MKEMVFYLTGSAKIKKGFTFQCNSKLILSQLASKLTTSQAAVKPSGLESNSESSFYGVATITYKRNEIKVTFRPKCSIDCTVRLTLKEKCTVFSLIQPQNEC